MKCGSQPTKEAQAEPITTRVQNMDGVFHTGVGTETPAWLQTCWRTEGTMRSAHVTHDKRQMDGNLQTTLAPSSAHCGPDAPPCPPESDRLRGLRNERAKVGTNVVAQNKSAALCRVPHILSLPLRRPHHLPLRRPADVRRGGGRRRRGGRIDRLYRR